jgi:hypothetical protein
MGTDFLVNIKKHLMGNQLQFILKIIGLIFSWLLFPPLFFILSTIWKMPKKIWRVVLTIIAPLSLLLIIICSVWVYQNYHVYRERGSRKEIEIKTGIELPKYQKFERRYFIYGSAFGGDFTMEYSIQLDTAGAQDFYRQIEEKLNEQKNDSVDSGVSWSLTEEGNYHFSSPGINPLTQENLELFIDRKNALVRVIYGSW